MASSFTRTAGGLLYQEGGTSVLRIFIAMAGLTAILSSLIFITLIRQTGWPASGAQWGGIAASVLGLLTFWLFGGFCLWMAFHLTRQTVLFDESGRVVAYNTYSLARGRQAHVFAFSQIAGFEVSEHRPDDGAPCFAVVMSMRTGLRIDMGDFDTHSAARGLLATMAAMAGLAPEKPGA